MCGRYRLTRPGKLAGRFAIEPDDRAPHYNIAPAQNITAQQLLRCNGLREGWHLETTQLSRTRSKQCGGRYMSNRAAMIADYGLTFPLTSQPGTISEQKRQEMIIEYDSIYPLTSAPGKMSAHKPNKVLKFPSVSLSPEETIAAYDLAFPLTSAPPMTSAQKRGEMIAEYDLAYPLTSALGKISVPEETEDIQKRAA